MLAATLSLCMAPTGLPVMICGSFCVFGSNEIVTACLQLNGTMNWSCPPALDWFHGGLQFQIEHHIFPRLPRHNLRAASRLVQPLCKQHGLPYISPGFIEATFMTLQTLRSTALKAKRHELLTI